MRDPLVYIHDMRLAAEKIQRYTSGMSKEEFLASGMAYDAVIRNLLVIGEAARHFPTDLHAEYAGVDFHRLKALRNILIHEYFAIDDEILWDIISMHLPELIRLLGR